MRTIKIIAIGACLMCATAIFGLKLAIAQEAGAVTGKGTTSTALAPNASPLAGTVQTGSGDLRFLGLSVYQARLWVHPLFEADDFGAHPLALELIYQRAFSAETIAKRSIAEMRRIGPFSAAQATLWQQALQAALPDVQAGDRLVGLYQPGTGATFQLRGRTVGTVADPAFARLFFGIWLSPLTSEPQLRTALLGTRAPEAAPAPTKPQRQAQQP